MRVQLGERLAGKDHLAALPAAACWSLAQAPSRPR